MALYTKEMSTLQVKLDGGMDQGKQLVISKSYENVNKSISVSDDAKTTALFVFAEKVAAICDTTVIDVLIHQHGTIIN